MKKIIFKLTRVVFAVIMIIASTSILNAQPNPGGLTSGISTADNAVQAALVPFDTNMTLLFVGAAILFFAYKYKKGQLSILG